MDFYPLAIILRRTSRDAWSDVAGIQRAMGPWPRRMIPEMFGFRTHFACLAVGVAAASLVPLAPASAAPTPLGIYQSWSAYETGTGEGKTCYALSRPIREEPSLKDRGKAYFLVSDWPQRKAKAETEVVPGYPYKHGAKVTVRVGSDSFSFFTRNDGDSGAAWVEVKADEQRLVSAMRRGAQMTVRGVSTRGTVTQDTYSLAGVSAALERIHRACHM